MKHLISRFSTLLVAVAYLSIPAAAQVTQRTQVPSPWSDPRKPIQSLAGSASAMHVIDQPGSYVLTGNLTGEAGKKGVEVLASDVTIDLMGFVLQGGSVGVDGIHLAPGKAGLVVTNGTIRGWLGSGVAAGGSASYCRIDRLRVFANGVGLLTGEGSRIERCVAVANAQGIGARHSDIEDCLVSESSFKGVEVTGASKIRRTIARNTNGSAGTAFSLVEGGSLIEECVANRGNISLTGTNDTQAISKVRRCVVAGSTSTLGGIYAYFASRIEDNLSTRNSSYAVNISGPGASHAEGNFTTTSGANAFRMTSFGLARANASVGNASGDNWDFSNNAAAGSFIPPGAITSSNPHGHPLF